MGLEPRQESCVRALHLTGGDLGSGGRSDRGGADMGPPIPRSTTRGISPQIVLMWVTEKEKRILFRFRSA